MWYSYPKVSQQFPVTSPFEGKQVDISYFIDRLIHLRNPLQPFPFSIYTAGFQTGIKLVLGRLKSNRYHEVVSFNGGLVDLHLLWLLVQAHCVWNSLSLRRRWEEGHGATPNVEVLPASLSTVISESKAGRWLHSC